jgi:hypothetical protein
MTAKLRRRAAMLAGIAIGATAMYYFDPDRGHGRRIRARDQLAAKRRRMQRERERAARYQAGVMQGLAHTRGPEHAPADDLTLVDRIKSELGSAASTSRSTSPTVSSSCAVSSRTKP